MGMDPITSTIVGGAALLGSDSGSSQSVTKSVEPESDYESAMRQKLTSLANTYLNQAPQIQQSTLNTQQGLINGQLPSAFTDNFTAAVKSGVNNTVGSAVNTLGKNGVLNSSVTTDTMGGIADKVKDAAAQNYQQNLGLIGSLNAGQNAIGQQMQNNANDLYKTWRATRYGVQSAKQSNDNGDAGLSSLGSTLFSTGLGKLIK